MIDKLNQIINLGGRYWSEAWINGAAAKVMNFGGLLKKVRPGTFGKGKSRLTGVPKKSPCQKTWNSQWTH